MAVDASLPRGHGKTDSPYDRLLGTVLGSTGASLAFLVHEGGRLLALSPQGPRGSDLAHQAAGMAGMAARMAQMLGVGPMEAVILEGRAGRMVLIRVEELILGCVVPPGADIATAAAALRRALEAL